MKALAKLGVAFAALLFGSVVMAPAASASTSAYQCASNQLCFYKDAGFTGTTYVAYTQKEPFQWGDEYGDVQDANFKHYTNGDSLDNSISSFANNLSLEVYLYTGTYYTGEHDWYPTHLSIRQVGWNDQISSIRNLAYYG